MRLLVLVSSEDAFRQAGVRIRYQRIAESLKAEDGSLTLMAITGLDDAQKILSQYDSVLISKCYTVRGLLAAKVASQLGLQVGIDMFDDYFSQTDDPRFSRLRYWLAKIQEYCTFVLCSTGAIRSVSESILPKLPHHVMNDPFDQLNPTLVEERVSKKAMLISATKNIQVAWFGIGDNPNFSVGLVDLVGFSGDFSVLRDAGYSVQLKILTNERALTSDNLSLLASLDVDYSIDLWSEEKEAKLLEDSFLAYLPVNAQPFSRVKSLNRCVTALCSGIQVLSNGYPLYKDLGRFIYSDVDQLVSDLDVCSFKVNASTVSDLKVTLEMLANPEAESRGLFQFLNTLSPRVIDQNENKIRCAVVHGRESSGDAHKFARKNQALSVSSPYCRLNLNYDVLVRWSEDSHNIEILVSEKTASLLGYVNIDSTSKTKFVDTNYFRAISDVVPTAVEKQSIALSRNGGKVGYCLSCSNVLGLISRSLSTLYPNLDVILSENSKLPWLLS
ncbi:hypothetical protein L1F30_08405 [Simiduia sp. 21SJ11W-1]|uniref:hypothetical protein n=1 Tax=Simiduia sp. 21SJ11W-1 TaxID=2909669 RepID=UPI00209EFABA|nr:hypothetical protein [Simiduia sp. 21SJ11W-1]UTA49545.1 hypothetical protein L1F30_08405 [Simiduia sp. 21SJ11W-1]